MILNCEHVNGAKFLIDTNNKTIVWDTEGYNRTGDLEKHQALNKYDNGEYEEIITLVGVYAHHHNGNSYCTPNIFKKDIKVCNNWETLEILFTL
jgi:hypothetical protein